MTLHGQYVIHHKKAQTFNKETKRWKPYHDRINLEHFVAVATLPGSRLFRWKPANVKQKLAYFSKKSHKMSLNSFLQSNSCRNIYGRVQPFILNRTRTSVHNTSVVTDRKYLKKGSRTLWPNCPYLAQPMKFDLFRSV